MPKIRDDKETLDAFMRAHTYPAQNGLLVKQLMRHPVHARSDRGNAAAYFQFPGLKALEAHVSELPAGASATLHRHSCEALFYVLKGTGLYGDLRQRRFGAAHQLEEGRSLLYSDLALASACEWQCKFRVAISRDYHDSSHEIVGNMVD
jgi:auxin binding protein